MKQRYLLEEDDDDYKPDFYVEKNNIEEKVQSQQHEEFLISNLFAATKRTPEQIRLEKDDFTARRRRERNPKLSNHGLIKRGTN